MTKEDKVDKALRGAKGQKQSESAQYETSGKINLLKSICDLMTFLQNANYLKKKVCTYQGLWAWKNFGSLPR